MNLKYELTLDENGVSVTSSNYHLAYCLLGSLITLVGRGTSFGTELTPSLYVTVMACTLAKGVRTPWNRERLYKKKISIQSNLDARNGLAVSENDLFKNFVNTLCRFLKLFIACSDNVCVIYKPAYALPMLYKTVQFLSVVYVLATISPSPE